ncbi:MULTISPECIES: DeoR/GlpR family DNA-binding transcription regulator [unclassified Sporolactobacillus]|uniref:DeoR/GlpR family DNA-binding transcription regulator n=1 Tax=unclassified Sporolactobacillus TaxID=2628533 RepID=UPI002367D1DE|nr:DeoR/GlpR family DNA-binding transcription regulator [Sporolactobacillus sp. CQH2019]MDD9149361.1 DeoR/GlpR family DNA-binding transcription regulator [Sporolactobacillus sp. CQH2019]
MALGLTERENDLLNIVNERIKIDVNELAELLNVSKVTIRKDLDRLESKGLLQRKHGYAVINNADNVGYRLAKKYDVKKRIARLAAQSIHDNETIMIESGSTCALLAEEIAATKQDITIITNSFFIASYIGRHQSVRIILLGGTYQEDSQVTVGPITKQNLREFFVDKLFIGTDGFDRKIGFFQNDIMRAEVVQTMALSSRKTIILTDSSKFYQKSLVKQFSLNEIQEIYTDRELDEDTNRFIADKGVTLHLA